MLCAGACNGAIWSLIRTRTFLLPEQVIRSSKTSKLRRKAVLLLWAGAAFHRRQLHRLILVFPLVFHWDSSKKDCQQGMVRWCEMISEQTRAGIESMYLHGSSRESFAGWLEKERPQLHPEGMTPKVGVGASPSIVEPTPWQARPGGFGHIAGVRRSRP
jgi:hypothetical protein